MSKFTGREKIILAIVAALLILRLIITLIIFHCDHSEWALWEFPW